LDGVKHRWPGLKPHMDDLISVDKYKLTEDEVSGIRQSSLSGLAYTAKIVETRNNEIRDR
jgi:hypothetical protein